MNRNDCHHYFFVLGPEIYCRPVLLEMYRFTSNFNLFFVLSNTIPQSQFRKTPQGKSSKYFVIKYCNEHFYKFLKPNIVNIVAEDVQEVQGDCR